VPHLGAPAREVAIRASDGVRTHGWYIRPRNGALILVLHGAGGDRMGTESQARMFVRHGYGVLELDARGRGRSGGDSEGYGWHWDRDVRAAVTFAVSRPGVDSVGVFGLSTGAEVAVQAAAEDTRIRAVVADGVQQRTGVDSLSTPGAAKAFLVPFAFAWQAAYQFLTVSGPPPPLKKLVARISPRPLLLIGTKAELPIDRVWIHNAKQPKALYALPDTDHTRGLATHPRAYERRVIGFFDRALLRTA
jgi:pimeloyl-ACP methyl ester carboxylesterase